MTVTVPIRYVRAAVALGARQDWDVAAILRDAHMSPVLLNDPRSRVTADQAARIARAVWRHTGDELLGLGPGPVPRGTFQLFSYGIIGANDAHDALRRFAKFAPALPGVPPLTTSTWSEHTTLSIDTTNLDDQDGLLVDTLLAVCHRFIGWLLQARVPLLGVEVPYPRPDDISVYADLFGRVPTFDAPTARLVIDNSIIAMPLMRDEASLRQYLADAPAGLLARREHGGTLTDRVRRIVERDLPNALSADHVAAQLSMAGPTLRRKLREEGTSYRQIREDLLCDLAIQALVHTPATVAGISARLGFSEPSAFVRAFRRWTGMAPGTYRGTSS